MINSVCSPISAENTLELGRLALGAGNQDQARILLEQAVTLLTQLHVASPG